MGLVAACHRCKKPPRACRCFKYFARTGMPAAFLPGMQVAIITSQDAADWHEIALRLSPAVTQAQLKASLPSVLAWRDGLNAFQGPWIWGARNQLLEQMHTEQAEGCSYARWAERLNTDLARNLNAHHQGANWPAGLYAISPQTGRARAGRLLRDLGFGDQEAEEVVAGALDRLARGQDAFLEDQPVSRDRVIALLRTWRRRRRRPGYGEH